MQCPVVALMIVEVCRQNPGLETFVSGIATLPVVMWNMKMYQEKFLFCSQTDGIIGDVLMCLTGGYFSNVLAKGKLALILLQAQD